MSPTPLRHISLSVLYQSIDIGVGIRIGDMGQLNSLVPLELGGWYAP